MSKLKDFFIGKPKDPLDPQVFHNLSLVAFFAWIGLGADGLSSSCYGPEEAFRSLGSYTHLGIFLAIAVAATVLILSASYSQIIELFPAGGGGYLVATELVGPITGLVSGSALLVDYVLTVAISSAASMDAIFSFLPMGWATWRLSATLLVLFALIALNLRGIKESVIVLTPIFIIFVVSHVFIILYGVSSHGSQLPSLLGDTIKETSAGISSIGFWALLFIFLKAFSLGGGTFTGIEAVSNGLQILREPRVATGKRTMMYMALSLAFTAGGILVAYLLNGIHAVPGQTLNATLVHKLADHWPFGKTFYLVTMLSEGALLIVASQAGFLDGPRVMANMAHDNWLPHRFKNLSDRLVIKDGILVMGLAAVAVVLYSRASVQVLVVMYSINVFITFSLSQFGMVRHWLKTKEKGRIKKLAINLTGLSVTLGILIITSVIKFEEGGWVTLVITGSLITFCIWVHKHYLLTGRALKHLDEILTSLPLPEKTKVPDKTTYQPAAVLLVNGYNGIGIHSFLAIHKSFPGHYKNFVFVSVGVLDSDRFKSIEEIESFKTSLRADLDRYVELANRLGFYAEFHMLMETDVTEGLETICEEVARGWPKVTFFTGQLVFERETMWNRLLHNQTAFSLQRKLLFRGLEVVILPLRVRLSQLPV